MRKLGLGAVLMLVCAGTQASPNGEFDAWLAEFRKQAQAAGISEATLNTALSGVQPIERVIELDRRQPEFTQTFWDYLDKRVTSARIEKGRRMLKQHRRLLEEVHAKYGVPPRYLVAFWGLETNFGDYLGSFPVVSSLATLAFDPRRNQFFGAQLLDALRILDQGLADPGQLNGSWAGAMGHLQFIPSTYLRYAVDANADGKRDVWSTLPDVFHSGANYLSAEGWRHGELWGREVRLPEHFPWEQAHLDVKRPVSEWVAMGVKRADGSPLPAAGDQQGAIVLPQGHRGPAFLVYHNFEVTLHWNRSINYGIAVGHLADRLIGLPPLRNGRAADSRPLSREQALEMQQLLNTYGFDVGAPDGVPGRRTRTAVRAFQKAAGLPVDGYPSVSLLEYLREHSPAHSS